MWNHWCGRTQKKQRQRQSLCRCFSLLRSFGDDNGCSVVERAVLDDVVYLPPHFLRPFRCRPCLRNQPATVAKVESVSPFSVDGEGATEICQGAETRCLMWGDAVGCSILPVGWWLLRCGVGFLKKKQKKLQENLVVSEKVCTFAPANAEKHCMKQGSGFSAVGSAHVWGARGRWFESSNPDQRKIQTSDNRKFGFLFYTLKKLFIHLCAFCQSFRHLPRG